MIRNVICVSAFTAFAALAIAGSAFSQTPTANVAGTYHCEAEADGCKWSGMTFTVTQMGNTLDVKNEMNEIGTGHLTSNITISMGPPWNMLGVIHEGNTIEWSNGTLWKKQ
jgi:hypothetical protein